MIVPDPEQRFFTAIVLEVPDILDGDLTAGLGRLATGSESAAAEEGRCRLSIYLRAAQDELQAIAALRAMLRESGIDPEECRIRAEAVVDGLWVERYQASLKPFPIGERFEVHPASKRSAASGRLPLLLIPGRAFGTGEHATTRQCVEMLERHVRPGSSWLDLGCGSALLAMVAYHCGAKRVLALDNDPEALEVARVVLESNELSDAVELQIGTLAELAACSWSGIVANISGHFCATHAGLLYARLEPGGLLIASGFSPAEREDIERALAAAGFAIAGRGAQGEWAVIVASRSERGAP